MALSIARNMDIEVYIAKDRDEYIKIAANGKAQAEDFIQAFYRMVKESP